jgi:RNA polymerase sigma-70 factor (sigma-E family)
MDRLRQAQARREFDAFVEEATDGLLRTGYLMTWDLSEAEDLVQETLVRVARRWTRVGVMDHPVAYARRVLVNLVIDGRRSRARRRAELEAGEHVRPDDRADTATAGMLGTVDTVSELRWALGVLTRRQRAVIVLRYWEDLSEVDVAGLLGCSTGTVKSTASRGLARLRAVIAATPEPVVVPSPTDPHERKAPSC